jgi:hypothetical protein
MKDNIDRCMTGIRTQSDKDLADTGRMLAEELNKISLELQRRGWETKMQGYYVSGYADRTRWEFECVKTTEERI